MNAEVERLLEIPTRGVLPTKDELELVRINELLRDVTEGLCKLRQDIRCVWHLHTNGEVAVKASRRWLIVAIEMLVGNALQAMSNGGELTIDVWERDKQIKIRIADTGPGIPELLRAKLFKQPLTREDGIRGSGMGLLMVKTILEVYKGDISLDSTGTRGTVFVVSLPRASRNL